MKRIFAIILLITGIYQTNFAQVGIGTANPDSSSILEIQSTNKGVLFPKVALQGANIVAPLSNPAKGLIVWNTGTSWGSAGFYYNDSNSVTPNWTKVASGAVMKTTLTDGKIWIGNVSNIATEQTLSGDVTITNAGISTISNNAVTSAKIMDTTIATNDIANNAITGIKINITGNIHGSLMYYNGVDWVNLAPDTAGKILQTNGAGAPTWVNPNTTLAKKNVITTTTGVSIMNGASQVVGDSNVTINIATNSATSPGLVSSAAGQNTKVWGTDVSGNPSWKDVGTLFDAQNGLRMDTTSPNASASQPYLELGGPLVRNTTITQGNFNYTHNMTGTGIYRVNHTNTTAATTTSYPFGISRAGITEMTIGSDATYVYMQSWNSKPLQINNQGNNVLINPNTGNVGIGQISANSKVDISMNARSGTHGSGFPLYVTGPLAAGSAGSTGIEFRHENGTQGIGFGYSTMYATGSNTNQDLGMRSRGAGSLIFSTDASTRMFISGTNGRVGIGTTTPGYLLDLNGGTFGFGTNNQRTETRENAGLQGNAGAQSGFFETFAPTNFPAGASTWWHLIDSRHSNTTNNYAMQIAGSFFDQDIYFRKTNGSATTAWSKFLTTASGWTILGNAGINDPAAPVTYGTTNFASNENWIGTKDANDIAFGTNSIERMRIKQSTGNIGIGVAAPAQPLEVYRNSDQSKTVISGYARQNSVSTDYNNIAVSGFGRGGNGTWGYGIGVMGIADQSNSWYAQGVYAGLSANSPMAAASVDAALYADASNLGAAGIFLNGNVGIGQTAPGVKLDVLVGNAMGMRLLSGNAAQYTGLSMGRTAGEFSLGIASTAGQWSSDALAGDVVIRTESTNRLLLQSGTGISAMMIRGDGRVQIGDLNGSWITDAEFGVVRNNNNNNFTAAFRNGTNAAGLNRGIAVTSGQNTWTQAQGFIAFYRPDQTQIGSVTQNSSTSISYNTTSDIRLKTNFTETQYGLNTINKIQVKDYFYKEDLTRQQNGFIAQQLYEVFPHAVTVGGEDVKENPWMVDYSRLTPPLVKAVQELSKENDDLKKAIETLTKRLELLEQK